jgi:hypothetical protein
MKDDVDFDEYVGEVEELEKMEKAKEGRRWRREEGKTLTFRRRLLLSRKNLQALVK